MPGVRALAATLAISAAGTVALVQHEAKVNRVYLDPVGIPTVCVGHIKTVTHADVGKLFSDAQCAELLSVDSAEAQEAVRKLVKVPVTQAQYDNLVSFVFNVGPTAFANSTLLRKLNAGDYCGAGNEFGRWVMAKGKRLRGLEIRRAHEAAPFKEECK